MNVLDRILAPIAPGLVAQRLASRQAIRAYEAASPSRTHKAKGQALSGTASVGLSSLSIRKQARKLDEDHDLVIGLFDRLEERVVGGDGITVEPMPRDRNGNLLTAFAAQIKAARQEWALKPEVTGEYTLPQVERLVVRSWLRDGEVLAQLVRGTVPLYTHLTAVPFALELLEADYLPLELSDKDKGILQGIERDAWRRVRAFHVLREHPGDFATFSLATKRVPAENMLYLALRRRIGQNRGMSLLHGALIRLADLKDYEESERVAARIAAALAMYIKKGNADNFDKSPGPERTFEMRPGMVFDGLKEGEDIGMVESNRPNPLLEGFRNAMIRAVAAGTRSTYSSVARSYDGTYSAQRQELVEGYEGYYLLQREFIDSWARPIHRNWLAMAVASGVLTLPPELDPSTLYSAFYMGPVMPWINPVQEANAWETLIKAGAADEAEVARARGRDPQELKASRTAEIETNRQKGLVFSSDAYHDHYANKGAPANGQKK